VGIVGWWLLPSVSAGQEEDSKASALDILRLTDKKTKRRQLLFLFLWLCEAKSTENFAGSGHRGVLGAGTHPSVSFLTSPAAGSYASQGILF
jgi:hypothetical protein